MKMICIVAYFAFCVTNLHAQVPSLVWQQCYGGNGSEYSADEKSLLETADGGYIMSGSSESNDLPFAHGSSDVYIVKVDSLGALQWQRCYGGTGAESCHAILQINNEYVFVGSSSSTNGDVQSPAHGSSDVWVVKIDSSGNILWENRYGGSDVDYGSSIVQTADNGYLIAGLAQSSDGDVNGFFGFYDAWLIKIDSSGELQWQQCYGGSGADQFKDIERSTDGGYMVLGSTNSGDGNVTCSSAAWLIKLDSLGGYMWQICIEGSGGKAICQLQDGGYAIVGNASILLPCYHLGWDGNNYSDGWVAKINALGVVQWQNCIGGDHQDGAENVRETNDGGCLVVGYASTYMNCSENPGASGFVEKVDADGNVEWYRCTGYYGMGVTDVIQLATGEFVIMGITSTALGEVDCLQTSSQYWLAKLSAYTQVNEVLESQDITVFPNPVGDVLHVQNRSSTKASLRLLNILGQTCLSDRVNATSISDLNVASIPKGVYILEVTDDTTRNVRRVVIE